MQTLLPHLTVLTGFAVVLAALARPARYLRRRGAADGGAGGALAAYEEAFRATGHAAHHEIPQQAGRRAPTGSPRPRKA